MPQQLSDIQVTPEGFAQYAQADTPTSIEQKFDHELLREAMVCWEALADFRARRRRARDYYRGKGDEPYTNPDTGEETTENAYIRSQGRTPRNLNRIRPLVMNLKGQFRQSGTDRIAYGRTKEDPDANEMMTEALRYACDVNRIDDVDADLFEEACISGLYGWKIGYKWHRKLNREEIIQDPIDSARIFFNQDLRDRRSNDLRIIGEVHDIDVNELIASFAKTPAHAAWLVEHYQYEANNTPIRMPSGFEIKDHLDFLTPNADSGLARLIEVWKLGYSWKRFVHDRVTGTYDVTDLSDAEIEQINQLRMLQATMIGATEMPPPIEVITRYEGTWTVTFMTPFGAILYQGETPYWHEEHPYILGFASLIDGDIWGVVEDVIDQQRLMNQINMAIEFMFGASAKGVLLVPEDALPEGVSIDSFASEWTKFNGVIKYKAKQGVPAPQQITQAAVPAGLFTWLNILQQDIRESSGVHGSIQGAEAPSGTPASLYNAQIVQAQTNNRDYFDAFFAARRTRDLKTIQLIQQYYDDVRYMAVSGRRADGSKLVKFVPSKVRDAEFEVIVSDTPETPAARQLNEEFIKAMLDTNRLTFRQFLTMSSNPKAEMILQVIDQSNPLLDTKIGPQDKQKMMMQLQQAAQQGDQDAMATLTQAQ